MITSKKFWILNVVMTILMSSEMLLLPDHPIRNFINVATGVWLGGQMARLKVELAKQKEARI